MRKPCAAERETIIIFNEANPTAEIEAHSPAMRRRLAALRRDRPDDMRLIRRDGCADWYSFPGRMASRRVFEPGGLWPGSSADQPKRWVKVIPPRKATEKQLEHLKQARERAHG